MGQEGWGQGWGPLLTPAVETHPRREKLGAFSMSIGGWSRGFTQS